MSYIAQVSITVQVSGGKTVTYSYPNPTVPVPPQFATSPATEFDYIISATNLTINVPTGALYMLIVPNSGNAVNLALKGVTGDTGFALHPSNPSLMAIPPATSTVIVSRSLSAPVYIL